MTVNGKSDGKIAVLLLDDDGNVTEALRIALRRYPFAISIASNAKDALELLAKQKFDVVVSDECMPGMSGSAFLSIVRGSYPDVIRIILSGQASVTATLRAINEARVERFLTKPVVPAVLANCIMDAVDLRRRRDEDGAAKEERRRVDCEHLRASFNRALDALWIAAQPIVRANDGKLVAYEMLMRSDDPEFATPDRLLAAANDLNAVTQLDAEVRVLVAEAIDTIPEPIQILVNLSPQSLLDPDLGSRDSALHKYRSRVILELTEQVDLHKVPAAFEKITALRTLGYRIALDDLGAGYAGLTSFVQVRPDVVKFDMELIRDIPNSPTQAALVAAMAGLFRQLGVATIAEGIENSAEYEAVRGLGCDLLQGYHIGRPARVTRERAAAAATPQAR